jgi:hypothetical protein
MREPTRYRLSHPIHDQENYNPNKFNKFSLKYLNQTQRVKREQNRYIDPYLGRKRGTVSRSNERRNTLHDTASIGNSLHYYIYTQNLLNLS